MSVFDDASVVIPEPEPTHPLADRLTQLTLELQRRGHELGPHLARVEESARQRPYAQPHEIARDVAEARDAYAAESRDLAREALAEGGRLVQRHAKLIPAAARKARKQQDAITPRFQAL